MDNVILKFLIPESNDLENYIQEQYGLKVQFGLNQKDLLHGVM